MTSQAPPILDEWLGGPILGPSKIAEEKHVNVCGLDICLTVTITGGSCPVPFKGEPVLSVRGDIGPMVFSLEKGPYDLVCEGDTVTFGSTAIQFGSLPDRVVVDGASYLIGDPASAVEHHFHNGKPVGMVG